MAENEYKISLGVDVDVSDIQSQISTKTKDTTVPIKIEIENLKDIKTQIQNLNKGNKPSLDISTVSLEKSLDRVAIAIEDIKKSLNTVDGKSGMQSLLSSINQITTALGKAENETDSLVKSLSALSKKDLSLNLGINMGKSAVAQQSAYGDLARGTIIPQLKQQVKDIVQQYNTAYKTVSDAQEALLSLTQGTKIGFNLVQDVVNNRKNNLFTRMEDGSNLKQQIAALKEYITLFEQAANIKNPQLASSVSGASQIADKLETDAKNAREGVTQLDNSLQKLKSVLNTGIDANALSVTLDPILQDLKAIREAIDNLSKGTSIDGLTASFNRLSDVLDKLDVNFDKIKSSLGNELAKSISADNAVKTAQHTGQQIGEAISDGIKQSLDIDSAIDKEAKRLMKLYGVNGKDAFNDIRQSLVDYRNNNSLNEEDVFSSSGIRQVTSAIADNRSEVIKLDAAYEDLLKDIKAVNDSKGTTKVRLSDMRSEWGDDYKNNKKLLGSWFSDKYTDGIGIDSWVKDKSWSYLLDLDTSHQDIANQLIDLVSKAKAQTKKVSGDELFKIGSLNMDDMESEIMASINAINAAEQKMAQSSTQSANTIVQNQQRIQQSYEDTLAKQKQRVNEIDREITDYTNRITDPTRLDPNVDPFQQIEGYQNSIDTLEREKVEILANIEKIESAFKKNENVLNSFKKSLSNIGMGADEIDEVAKKISNLGVQIETLNQKKSTRMIKTDDEVFEKEVLDVDISGVDEYGNAIKLTQQYDMATADLIKSIEKVSTVQQKAGASTDTFAKKQKTAVSNLTNQINQVNRAAIDQNANRPIKEVGHLDTLANKYDEITLAIQRMENASSDTFVDEQNNVRRLISEFKSLVKEYKNAENVSTKMKGTDFASGLDIAKNDLEKFKAQAKDFPQITQTIENLDRAIEGVGDSASLNKFNDQLRVARSELAKIKSETTATNRNEKVGINVSGLESKIADLQRISPEIDKFEAEIDGAKVSVQSLLKDLGQVKTQGDFSVVNSRFKAFTDSAKAAGIAVTEVARKMKSVDDIKLDMELGTYDNQLSQMYDKLDRLSGASKELRNGIEQVENAYREMNNALKGTGDEVADKERLVQAEKDYAAALEKTNNLIKIQSRAEAKDARKDKLENDIKLFQADIDRWLVNNSAATKQFGSQMLDLRAKAEGVDRVTLNGLIGQFKLLDKQADKAGLKMMSVSDKIKSKFKEYMAYFSVAEIFMEVTQAMKRMFDTVVEIDTAMTGLYRVTDLTSAQYDTLFDNMISSAKEYGATLNDIINATTDWVRAGFDADTALGLAEVTTMYQHISDLDYDTAAENLITAYNGFKEELNGAFDGDQVAAVNYIADILNELDNNYAATSAGIGEALTRSASALDLAGNSIQETAGMITGIIEVTQDPEQAGSTLKILSLRLRGMKGQLEELGEETDENVENISKMQGQILKMTGGKVNIFDASGNFKSTYEIMKGISEVWDELSSIDQADLLETIAGKMLARIHRNMYIEYI